MRLLVLYKSGFKMLIDGGETRNNGEKPEPSHSDVVGRRRTIASTSQSYQPRAIQAMNKYRDNVGARPSWLAAKPIAPPPPSQHCKSHKYLGNMVDVIVRDYGSSYVDNPC